MTREFLWAAALKQIVSTARTRSDFPFLGEISAFIDSTPCTGPQGSVFVQTKSGIYLSIYFEDFSGATFVN